MAGEIVNKIAKAGIEQIDLVDFVNNTPLLEIDLKNHLWNEMVLREKEFRSWIKTNDWNKYQNKIVYIYCSSDAIIPAWAYMLLVANLQNTQTIIYGNENQAKEDLFFANLENWDTNHLIDKRVMVKGCSSIPNPNKAYVVLTNKLVPIVKSLMFGEPCSAVPVYKK